LRRPALAASHWAAGLAIDPYSGGRCSLPLLFNNIGVFNQGLCLKIKLFIYFKLN